MTHPHGGTDGEPAAPPGVPRWVKVAAILAGILLLLFLVLRFTGVGGEHGPSRHGVGASSPATGMSHRAPTPGGTP